MSTQKTQHYQLHKWSPDDQFLRSEFNENFDALDAALSDCPRLAVGYYNGDGEAQRTISVGFLPRAVLILERGGSLGNSTNIYGGLAVTGSPARNNTNGEVAIAIQPGGFKVYNVVPMASGPRLNAQNFTYHYIALR